jgi:hypothetical protein
MTSANLRSGTTIMIVGAISASNYNALRRCGGAEVASSASFAFVIPQAIDLLGGVLCGGSCGSLPPYPPIPFGGERALGAPLPLGDQQKSFATKSCVLGEAM